VRNAKGKAPAIRLTKEGEKDLCAFHNKKAEGWRERERMRVAEGKGGLWGKTNRKDCSLLDAVESLNVHAKKNKKGSNLAEPVQRRRTGGKVNW